MAAGLSVIRQDDFSAGAFPNSTAERIPRNGFWSSSNMLVDDVGALYKRGGSTLLAGTSSPASQIVWVWQGTLTGRFPDARGDDHDLVQRVGRDVHESRGAHDDGERREPSGGARRRDVSAAGVGRQHGDV
jgi:hypothetical protein